MTRTVLDEEGRPADRTSKTLKPTKTIWVTKEGQRIRVRDMADSHLLNTIKMLRRSAGERHTNAIITGYSVLNFLQGEMAILSVEQDLAKLEETDPIDFLIEELPIYETMEREAERRGLDYEDPKEKLTPYMRRKGEKLIAENKKKGGWPQ